MLPYFMSGFALHMAQGSQFRICHAAIYKYLNFMSSSASQHEYDQSQHETQGSSSHGGARHLVWSPLGIEVFLQIVETHLAQLNDNKTKKNKVWNKISRELNAKVSGISPCSVFCRPINACIVQLHNVHIFLIKGKSSILGPLQHT